MPNHSGGFFDKSNNVKYEHDTVMSLNYMKPSYLSRDLFEALSYVCRDCGVNQM